MKPGFGRIQTTFIDFWKGYWATRYVSALSVVPTSYTEQTITATIVGTGYDSVSYEYSTDNINFTEKGTSLNGTYNATGLTIGVLYYWRARLYKDAHYGAYSSVASEYTWNSMTFSSVQPAALDQVIITYKIDSGKSVYINWGYGSDVLLTADGTDKTITSVFPTNNTTYTITFSGDISYVKKFFIYNEPTVVINSNQVNKFRNLTWLEIRLFNTTGSGFTCNSVDLVSLTHLTNLIIREPNSSSIFNTVHLVDLPITQLQVIYSHSTNMICNSSDIEQLTQLEDLYLSIVNHAGSFSSSAIVSLPITKFYFTSNMPQDSIRSADFVGKQLTLWHRYGDYGDDVVNSVDFVDMPLITWENGHTGTETYINSAHFSNISTLSIFALYSDVGATYTIDLSHFSSLTSLTSVYFNGNTISLEIVGKISDLPTGLTTMFFNKVTNLDITTGTMKAWTNATITLTNAHTTEQVDGFLNAWATPAGTATKTINLAGTGVGIANQARSAASDAAVVTLNGKGKTITTNS